MKTGTVPAQVKLDKAEKSSLIVKFGMTVGFVFAAFGALSQSWRVMPSDWEFRYAVQYGINSKNVIMQKRPHDCEWGSAPIGDKHCRYEPNIGALNKAGETVEKTDSTSTTKETPPNGDMAIRMVIVTWQKVEE